MSWIKAGPRLDRPQRLLRLSCIDQAGTQVVIGEGGVWVFIEEASIGGHGGGRTSLGQQDARGRIQNGEMVRVDCCRLADERGRTLERLGACIGVCVETNDELASQFCQCHDRVWIQWAACSIRSTR